MTHVFVIEDDSDIRETLGDLLEGEGYAVTLTADGQEALNELRGMPLLPDLILLDLMMPVKDGFEFRREQRADEALARIPVVVMSADPQLDTHRDLLVAGGYLRKPFDIEQLFRIMSLVQIPSSRREQP